MLPQSTQHSFPVSGYLTSRSNKRRGVHHLRQRRARRVQQPGDEEHPVEPGCGRVSPRQRGEVRGGVWRRPPRVAALRARQEVRHQADGGVRDAVRLAQQLQQACGAIRPLAGGAAAEGSMIEN